MTGIAGLPAAYRSALRAATEAALDSGLLYDNAIEGFVLAQIGQHDPARDKYLGTFDPPTGFPEARAFHLAMETRVVNAPRGAWAIIQHRLPDRAWLEAMMSDGTGTRSVGGSHDHYDEMPSFPDVHRRMAGYEIYKMRHEVEAARRRARNLAVISERGFTVGRSFHGLLIGRAVFSTVTIIALHPAPDAHTTIIGTDDRGAGWLSLGLTKSGSRKRYRADIAAIQLAAAIDAPVRAVNPTPLLDRA